MSTVNPITQPEDLTALNVPPTSLLVLYFHAPWAAPCAQMSAVLDALASTYPTSAPVVFAAANAEDLPDLAEDHDVTAVPFVVLKRGDAVLESISGSDASKVRAAVEKHVGSNGPAKGTALPPAQAVTRPKEQPAPADPHAGVNGYSSAAAAPTNGATPQASKDLSAYAPKSDAAAPADAPSEEELNKRLTELVKAAPVMLFMKGTPSAPQCGFSRQLVGILREQTVRYGFFNILADDDVRQGLKKFADWPTFPQLWLDGELIGGLDIVREEIENDASFFDSYKAGAAPAKAAA